MNFSCVIGTNSPTYLNGNTTNPIINAPSRKPILPSAAKTISCTGLKICMCTVLAQRSGQTIFSQHSC